MEQNSDYTLAIKFHLAGQSLPGVVTHFERLEDAFNKFLMIRGGDFTFGFGSPPYSDMPVSEVVLMSGQEGKILISAGVTSQAAGSEPKLAPGFYFRFPQTVSAFEEASGISFSDYRGYDPAARALMASARDATNRNLFNPTIAYENMRARALHRLSGGRWLTVSLQRYSFDNSGDYVGSLQPYPLREDYVLDNVDKALHRLLQTDFNTLDQSVAWENDLPYHITSAALCRSRHHFQLYDYERVARLRSVRRQIATIAGHTVSENGIYLELDKLAEKAGIKFPFSGLESKVPGPNGFLLGTYNRTLSRAEKVPGLSDYLEKKQQEIVAGQGGEVRKGKEEKPIENKRKKTGIHKGKSKGI